MFCVPCCICNKNRLHLTVKFSCYSSTSFSPQYRHFMVSLDQLLSHVLTSDRTFVISCFVTTASTASYKHQPNAQHIKVSLYVKLMCSRSFLGIVGSNPAVDMAVCFFCVLSGRGLCVGLITRPEESYRMWCVWVWSCFLNIEEAWPTGSCCAKVIKGRITTSVASSVSKLYLC